MAEYRKKPVVIDAMQLTEGNGLEVMEWMHQLSGKKAVTVKLQGATLLIDTLEGEMRGDPGDWIIRGIKGEFYPCKPDIFTASYEAVHA